MERNSYLYIYKKLDKISRELQNDYYQSNDKDYLELMASILNNLH